MTKNSKPLSANLGEGLVLAWPGAQQGRRLWYLDSRSAAIWQAHQAGLTPEEIAHHLSNESGATQAQILTDILQLLAEWQKPQTALDCALRLADRHIKLTVTDTILANHLLPLIEHLQTASVPTESDAHLLLAGTANEWLLSLNDAPISTGTSIDAALTQTLEQLIDTACATSQRLLVLHAAAVAKKTYGLVLVGSGGVGKTTLATGLNTQGWALLGDDVIPVTQDGKLLGLGLGPCLKAGSWPILTSRLANLQQTQPFDRLGQPVRIPPPPGPVEYGPIPTAAFILPRYQPGARVTLNPVSPEQILEAIIAAESIIRTLDQTRLNALVKWIASAPGFSLIYDDLADGIRIIEELEGTPR